MISYPQAAAKAFRRCRANHSDSRSVASYLTLMYLVAGGPTMPEASKVMPEANELLDKWFAERAVDPSFVPVVEAENVPGEESQSESMKAPESTSEPDRLPEPSSWAE